MTKLRRWTPRWWRRRQIKKWSDALFEASRVEYRPPLVSKDVMDVLKELNDGRR